VVVLPSSTFPSRGIAPAEWTYLQDGASTKLASPDGDVTVVFGQVTPPKVWADVIPFLRGADLSDPNVVPPDGIAEVPGNVAAGPDSTASGLVTLPAGALGALCATGTWPDLEWSDAGPFTVGG